MKPDFSVARLMTFAPPAVFAPGTKTTAETASLDPGFAWDEAIVSWNVQPATGAHLKVEARVVYPERMTKWYVLGDWSLDGPRQSVDGQKDEDGTVKTDTLSMNHPGGLLQLQITGESMNPESKLTFLGVCFSDASAKWHEGPSGRKAWGRALTIVKRNQNDYPGGGGLCSPTSVSMLMSHWAACLARPEMNLDVPQVQEAVWDPVYKGAGNWPFNMAFAGAFPGMRAYVARFAGLNELESWTAAGLPVVCSVSYQLLRGLTLDPKTEQGHLVLLLGFTASGDPVFNDPASRERPKVYPRDDFDAAWAYSHRTVYLAYPVGTAIPASNEQRWAAP